MDIKKLDKKNLMPNTRKTIQAVFKELRLRGISIPTYLKNDPLCSQITGINEINNEYKLTLDEILALKLATNLINNKDIDVKIFDLYIKLSGQEPVKKTEINITSNPVLQYMDSLTTEELTILIKKLESNINTDNIIDMNSDEINSD